MSACVSRIIIDIIFLKIRVEGLNAQRWFRLGDLQVLHVQKAGPLREFMGPRQIINVRPLYITEISR